MGITIVRFPILNVYHWFYCNMMKSNKEMLFSYNVVNFTRHHPATPPPLKKNTTTPNPPPPPHNNNNIKENHETKH